MKKIKICGLSQEENIKEIGNLQPDFMGFIFYCNSKRFVGKDFSVNNLKLIPKFIQKTAVFVNETLENMQKIAEKYAFDYVQLHGEEPVEICKKLKENNIKVIKAFAIEEDFDFTTLENYQNYCEYFLFDTKTPTYGGSGRTFNWQILNKYHLETPFFLSGGIGLENVKEALKFYHPKYFGLDCNSALENENYSKNKEKVMQLIDIVKYEK